MPQELTPEQRLTQIEKILESAIKLSHSNTARIQANAEASAIQDTRIDRLTQNIDRATEIFIDSMGMMRTVQTNVETVQTNVETVQTNIETVQTNIETVQTNIETVQTNIERIQSNIERMQSEIRGLQLENRRILDRLFGTEDAD